MEWGIIAVGAVFVVYLLYCFVSEWSAKRRFERDRRKRHEKAAAERDESKQD